MEKSNIGKFYDQAATTRYFTDLADAMDQFKTDAWYQELAQDDILQEKTYQGDSADATRELIQKKEKKLLNDIIDIQDDMIRLQDAIQEKFSIEVDSAMDARLEYDVLQQINDDFRTLYMEFKDNCAGVLDLEQRCQKYNKYANFTKVDFGEAQKAFVDFCGDDETAGFLMECQDKLIRFDEEVQAMIEAAGLERRIEEISGRMNAVGV